MWNCILSSKNEKNPYHRSAKFIRLSFREKNYLSYVKQNENFQLFPAKIYSKVKRQVNPNAYPTCSSTLPGYPSIPILLTPLASSDWTEKLQKPLVIWVGRVGIRVSHLPYHTFPGNLPYPTHLTCLPVLNGELKPWSFQDSNLAQLETFNTYIGWRSIIQSGYS